MNLTEFRDRTSVKRIEALSILPHRIQVMLAAEWARSVLFVLNNDNPEEKTPQLAIEAATNWALNPTQENTDLALSAGKAAFDARFSGNIYSATRCAATAARCAAYATIRPSGAAGDVAYVAGCVARAAQSPTVFLATKWKWLFKTYRDALVPSHVSFDPQWRTSTVLALAEGIVQDRALDRMPMLGDALRDAGCEEPAVVDHLNDECTLADWTLWNLLGLHVSPNE